jgi:hypothetical protein
LYLPIDLLAQALFCFFFANALLFGEALGVLFGPIGKILFNHFNLLDIFPIRYTPKRLHMFIKYCCYLVGNKRAFKPYRIALESHQEAMFRYSFEPNVSNSLFLMASNQGNERLNKSHNP